MIGNKLLIFSAVLISIIVLIAVFMQPEQEEDFAVGGVTGICDQIISFGLNTYNLAYTDENVGEDLIICSLERIGDYPPHLVPFSVTNITGSNRPNIDGRIWREDGYTVLSIKQYLPNVPKNKMVDVYGLATTTCGAGKWVASTTIIVGVEGLVEAQGYSCGESQFTYCTLVVGDGCGQAGQKIGTKVVNFTQNELGPELLLSPKTFNNEKAPPARFVKDGGFSFGLSAGETKTFFVLIDAPKDFFNKEKGQFGIEVRSPSPNSGYGILNPTEVFSKLESTTLVEAK